MNEQPQELDSLIEKLLAGITALSDHLSGEGSVDEVQSEYLARQLCLASRAAYSEFQALLIEHSPALPGRMARLREAHLRAVQQMEQIPAKTDNTLEFLDAVEYRSQQVDNVRSRVLAGVTS